MSQYESTTVKELLTWVEHDRVILPSMQRNFVWSPEKICDLFDSLASGYPIGTFLFWEVNRDQAKEFGFHRFVKRFDQSRTIQRDTGTPKERDEYYAVLDGQQRITSLNIGINGCLHLRKKKYSPEFVDKFLALNIFHKPEETDGEATSHYSFSFIESSELERLPIGDDGDVKYEEPFWVPVSKIVDKDFDESDYIDSLDSEIVEIAGEGIPSLDRRAMRVQMKEVAASINRTDAVSFYTAKDNNLAEVVEIFVRVNSGGQKLSASDLMLSIASGGSSVDAQNQIDEAIKHLKSASNSEAEFPADKELIIRAGLMFTNAESLSLSNKNNYKRERIEKIFKEHWDGIVDSLYDGIKLIEWLGFNVSTISKNLLLPVAYYLYKKKPTRGYFSATSGDDVADKLLIRQWIIRAIVKSIFRDGTGSTLIVCRNIINSSSGTQFPLDEFLDEGSPRNLRIGEESIDEIMRMTYRNSATRPILAVLSKQDDVLSFDVDHIWAQALISSKKKTQKNYPTISDEDYATFRRKVDNISNLQLLVRSENQKKSDKLYDEWLNETYSDSKLREYQEKNCIDPDAPTSFSSFLEFLKKREAVMRQRIKEEFPDHV